LSSPKGVSKSSFFVSFGRSGFDTCTCGTGAGVRPLRDNATDELRNMSQEFPHCKLPKEMKMKDEKFERKELRKLERDRRPPLRSKTPKPKAQPKVKATHTVAAGETLSDLALKYYGRAVKPFYMAIYEANKDVIGDSPNVIKPGMELKIPDLPDDFEG
jgi:nucleoid-associated protein YgaU